MRLCTGRFRVEFTLLAPAVLAWRYEVKVSKKRLRNKMRKLIGRRRAIARRLKEIDNVLAELGQLGRQQ